MRDLPAAFVTALQSDETEDFVVLVEFADRDGVVGVRRALWNRDISFDPDGDGAQTYYADVGVIDAATLNLDGEEPSLNVQMQNLRQPEDPDNDAKELPWTQLRASVGDFNEWEVRIRVINRTIAGPDAQIAFTKWYVSGYVFSAEGVRFTVGSPYSVLALQTCVPPLSAKRCIWRYKGPECGSLSRLKTCDKSPQACRLRFPVGAPLRYSSWLWSEYMVRKSNT